MARDAGGCGCQYDAAGRRFREHCVCPPEPPNPMDLETARRMVALGAPMPDAVHREVERTLLAEVERLRAVEQRAIDMHATGGRDEVLSAAHYILTGDPR